MTDQQHLPDDDFYGDQDDHHHSNEHQRQKREIDAIRRIHFTSGVRDGAADARDRHLQDGFDHGFSAGAAAVAEAGFLMGACSFLEAFFNKHGCHPQSSSKSQILADTEVLTSDLKELAEARAQLRDQLDVSYQTKSFHTARASAACEKVSLVHIPQYEQTLPLTKNQQ